MMKRQQFEEESLDYMSPSFNQCQIDDWIKTGVELEATEVSHSTTFLSQSTQRNTFDGKSEWKRQSIEHITKEFRGSSSHTNINNECCAFQKLEQVLRSPSEKQDTLSRKGPCHRLITWVAICRDDDPELDHKVKRSCPLAKCTFSCDPDDGELIRHILSCSFLKYGKYKCPYHNNEPEAFMVPQQRRSRKRWNRAHSVREAFRDICKLGSKGLHKAFGHSSKRRRSDDLETINSDNSEINPFEIDGLTLPQVCHKRTTLGTDTWLEKRQPPARRSQALQSQIQSQIREADDTTFINELGTEFCSELPAGQDLDLYSELPSIRFSSVQSDSTQSLTVCESSTSLNIDTSLPSPLSPTYVSSDRFESPISPEEVKGVVRWAEAVESSSGHQVSLDAVAFGWPMDQRHSLQTVPPMSIARSPNARLLAKGLKTIRLDTSVGCTKPVSAPKALTPVSPMERFPSSPDNPEVLSQEPSKFFEELRSIVQNTYTFTYSQLSRPPQLPISQEIIARQLTPSKVFSSGWEAVEKVLNGQLPQKFWWLFSLAQLAFACGQVVWEGELKHQLDDVVDDLKNWSYALRSPRERQCYLDVIEQIFVNEERKSAANNSCETPTSASSRSHRDTLSLDGQQLLAKLRNGPVIRLCLQFLSTFEFLQHRLDRINNASINGLASLLQTTDANDHNVNVLDVTVIRPLLAKPNFHDLGPVIEKASDLLYDYPNTSIRELELFLVCHARYYTKDHTLHLQFRNAVAECCFDAALQIPDTAEHYLIQENYFLQDVMAIRQCYKDLSTASVHPGQGQGVAPKSASLHVQELQGSPVSATLQQNVSPMPPKFEPHMQYQYRPHSYIQTPISASTASPLTAASSNCPSIWTPISASTSSPSSGAAMWTPISAHSISPATATESAFPSPYTSMCWPTAIAEETAYMHPNFPLPMNNDYTLLANEFLNNDPSLFEESIPTSVPAADISAAGPTDMSTSTTANVPVAVKAEPSTETEAKASLSCHLCGTTFNGKEQFLASNLRRHMRELHSAAVKGLTCNVCKKPFTRKHNLNVHLKTVHAEGRH